MSNRLLVCALVAALLMASCVPAAPENDRNTVHEISQAPVVNPVTVNPESTSTCVPPALPTEGNTEEKLMKMLPILDSIVRSMDKGDEEAYLPHDATYVWSVLYLMGENWGGTHPLVTKEGSTVTVPKKVMQEFASAAFRDYSDLLPIPKSYADTVIYDVGFDAYRLAPSDMGDAVTNIDRYAVEPDGSVIVIVGLYSGDQLLKQIRFSLANNPYVDGITHPTYFYSVQSAVYAPVESTIWQKIDPIAGPISVDLNEDGKDEVISCMVDKEDLLTINIAQQDGRIYTDKQVYLSGVSVHIGDTQIGDGYRELYVCGDTGSDDYVTNIYRIEQGNLRKAELWGQVECVDGNGQLRISTVVNILGTYGAVCGYTMNKNYQFERTMDYAVFQHIGSWDDRGLTTKIDKLPVTFMDTITPTTLPKGSRLLLLQTDQEHYAVLECPDGQTVRVELVKNTEMWSWSIDGTPEELWFGELFYAG
ncbi:MAG: hypothetical protein RR475_11935 [Clostridia bacterium]